MAVRKPGNVSLASRGHGMTPSSFIASAAAQRPAVVPPGAAVGERIERAVAGHAGGAGCNTNLGIVLLCAPIAAAVEASGTVPTASQPAVRRAANDACWRLDRGRCAGRLSRHRAGRTRAAWAPRARRTCTATPSVDLRDAMALAADRDMHRAPVRERLRRPVRSRPAAAGRPVSSSEPLPLPGKAFWRATPRPRASACLRTCRAAAVQRACSVSTWRSSRASRFTHCSQTRRGGGTQCLRAAQQWLARIERGVRCAARACRRSAGPCAWDRAIQGSGHQPRHQRRSDRGALCLRRRTYLVHRAALSA